MAIQTVTKLRDQGVTEACHFITLNGAAGKTFSLTEVLRHGAPVIVGLDPYVGEQCLPLAVEQAGTWRGLCYHSRSSSQPYCTPRYLNSLDGIAADTFLLLTHDDSGYTSYLCLSHADQTVSLNANRDGIILRAQSGASRRASQRRWALVCQRGNDIHSTLRRTIRLALHLTGNLGRLCCHKPHLPDWFNRLGWTSRLLCGQQPSFDAILNAVRSIQDQGFHLGYVIIEEGWQRLAINPKDRMLRPCLAGFDADEKRFSNGLRSVIDALRDVGIDQVGIWHTIMGARNGLHPDMARKYNLPIDESGRFFLGSDLGNTFEFFSDYYAYLRQQGVSFVEVGDQLSATTFCRDGVDVSTLYKNIQIAMQGAASTHFTTSYLNSDCLGGQNLFYWPNSTVARAAEDIDYANTIGIQRSIRNNLANSLWLQQLMLPDNDAWQTDGDANEMLATLHALSGSLMRIGDAPHHTNTALLRKIALPSGRVMKADKPLTLCRDCIFANPVEEKQVLKAFTTKGNAGIVATFNLCSGQRTVHGNVSANDIDMMIAERLAVFSHRHGFIGVVTHDDIVPITLKPKESDIFTFSPITSGIGVIGCHAFFLSPGPITEIVIEQESVHISSLIAAPLLVYCERQVLEIRRNDEVVPWEYDSRRCLLSLDTRPHIEESPSIYSISFE